MARGIRSAFVTGAGGFIGRHLVEELLAQGTEVIALMMPGEPVPKSWQDQVRCVTGDIRNLDALTDSIGPFDTIFHLAAVVSDWGARQEHIDITIGGTRQATALALRNGARFVVTTSICAFASALGQGEMDETTPIGKPSSPYEFCKQEQERVTREAVADGLDAVILRPSNVYGVGSIWVTRFSQMLREGAPTVVGDGKRDAGLLHVRNLVQALIAAARAEGLAPGEIFVISDGFGKTWADYVAALSQATGSPAAKSAPGWLLGALAPVLTWFGESIGQKKPPLITVQLFRLIGKTSVFKIDKARRLLGYSPSVSFEAAMEEIAASSGS